MKKILFVLVILFGGFVTPTLPVCHATEQAPMCDPSSPCVYTGVARASNGWTLNIKVYVDANGLFVAYFKSSSKEYTMYVISDEGNKYHINFDGHAYYFQM